MATFDVSPLFRSAPVGLDRTWNPLNTEWPLDSAGYPAYNILRTGEDDFRISLAVPGFVEGDITVETREGALWVKGSRAVDPNHNQYLYRGIDLQGFQRTFQLPEHVHVWGASLEAGMLHIDLERELPESMRPRQIEIRTDAPEKPALEEPSKAA